MHMLSFAQEHLPPSCPHRTHLALFQGPCELIVVVHIPLSRLSHSAPLYHTPVANEQVSTLRRLHRLQVSDAIYKSTEPCQLLQEW